MLRNYQKKSIELIRSEFQKGNRKCLLWLATGAGKTTIFCDMVRGAVANKLKCLIVVRRRALVENASQRLDRESVDHAIIMNGHWRVNYRHQVQVASVDTLISREYFPEADLIIVDECHDAVSEGYKEFLEHYKNAYIVGCTATPFVKESLRHVADAIVHPITMQELIDAKFLVPFRYFAPSTPDLKGVRTQNGEFVTEQLQERMNPLTGDIIQHWKSLGEGRPTLGFGVNLEHSKRLTAEFNSAGIRAEHIDASHSLEERSAVFSRLEAGETKIVFNVGVATTGVDVPCAACIIMARPTKSYNLFIQTIGRGTRIYKGKSDCILLDHAGNILRHGFPTDEPECFLDGMPRQERKIALKTCEKCFVIFTGAVCHACNWKPEAEERNVAPETEEGILEELKDLPQAAEISIFIRRQKELARRRGYKSGYVFHAVSNKYGKEIANTAFPNFSKRSVPWFLRKREA